MNKGIEEPEKCSPVREDNTPSARPKSPEVRNKLVSHNRHMIKEWNLCTCITAFAHIYQGSIGNVRTFIRMLRLRPQRIKTISVIHITLLSVLSVVMACQVHLSTSDSPRPFRPNSYSSLSSCGGESTRFVSLPTLLATMI